MQLKKHHWWTMILVGLFVAAWALWSFIFLPLSEMPSQPDPSAAPPPVPLNN